MNNSRFEKDVLRFQITMNQPGLLEHSESIEQLSCEDLDQLCTQPLELVLLDQLVQIRRKELEDEAKVIFMNERVA